MRNFFDEFFVVFALTSLLLVPSSCASDPSASTPVLIKVDKSGNGDFTRIQDAIDAVPPNNSEFVCISIGPGIYKEKVEVPIDKPFITLSGTGKNSTIISWSGKHVTSDAATLAVLASDFVGMNLTVENTFVLDEGPGKQNQAAALFVSGGERVAFYGCRFYSHQDTIIDNNGAHYYRNCYIQGATDFICGNGLAIFERCHMHSVSKGGGAITAQKRDDPSDDSAYMFVGGRITGDQGAAAMLGRPWGNYSRVVFLRTHMSDVVLAPGWGDWGDPAKQRTAYYGQYMCEGPGSNTTGRVKWSHELSYSEVLQFLNIFTSRSDWMWSQWLEPSFDRTISYLDWHHKKMFNG